MNKSEKFEPKQGEASPPENRREFLKRLGRLSFALTTGATILQTTRDALAEAAIIKEEGKKFDFKDYYTEKEDAAAKNLLPSVFKERNDVLANPQETDFGRMRELKFGEFIISPDGEIAAIKMAVKKRGRNWVFAFNPETKSKELAALEEFRVQNNRPELSELDSTRKVPELDSGDKVREIMFLCPVTRLKPTKGTPRAYGDKHNRIFMHYMVALDRMPKSIAGLEGSIKEAGFTELNGKLVLQYAGFTDSKETKPYREWIDVKTGGRRPISTDRILIDKLGWGGSREIKAGKRVDKFLITEVKKYLNSTGVVQLDRGFSDNQSMMSER